MADTKSNRPNTPANGQETVEHEPLLGLSLPQVMGGALAAATAAAIGSRLGVAGTVVGAALVSVVAAVAGAAYTRTIRHTGARVSGIVRRPGSGATRVSLGEDGREGSATGTGSSPYLGRAATGPAAAYPADADQTRALPIGGRVGETGTPASPVEPTSPAASGGGATAVSTTPVGAADKAKPRFKVAHLLGAAVAVFVLAALLVTGFEALTGHALSGGQGTTVARIGSTGSSGTGSTGERTPTPRPSASQQSSRPSATPSSKATPGSSRPTTSTSSEPTQRPTEQATGSGSGTGGSSGSSGSSGSGSGSDARSGSDSGSGTSSGSGSGTGTDAGTSG